MKKLLIICLVLLAGIQFTSAQSVVLEENVAGDTIVPNVGPNRTSFMHLTVGYGFGIGQPESGFEIEPHNSGNLVLGYTYKRRLGNYFAIGTDLFWSTQEWRIKQDDNKVFPDSLKYDKQKVGVNDLEMTLFLRINYNKRRGNHLGNFIDLGGYAGYSAGRFHYTKTELPSGEILKATLNKYDELEKYNYGLYARFGFNRWMVFGKYRLSKIVLTNGVADVPPLTIGLQIGVF